MGVLRSGEPAPRAAAAIASWRAGARGILRRPSGLRPGDGPRRVIEPIGEVVHVIE